MTMAAFSAPNAAEPRRGGAEAGELADAELNYSDAQWCGLYHRLNRHTAEETTRRQQLAMGLFEA